MDRSAAAEDAGLLRRPPPNAAGAFKPKMRIWYRIVDFFRSIVNFIKVFFVTMFSMEKSDQFKKGYGASKKWDGGPGGGGPYGGGGGPYGGGGGGRGGGPRTLSDLNGNNHNALPACGSCCG